MFKQIYQNLKKKKNLFFLAGGLIIIIACGFLIVFSLTFLIKNINLALKQIAPENSSIHFNISEAERLFLQDK
jgi:hypothetical protein